jgi:ribonuclease HI
MLDPIQNHSLRLCLGAFRTSPVDSLQVEANEPPLVLRRNKLAIQYATKLKSNPSNPAYQVTFNPQYKELFTSKPNLIPSFGLRTDKLLLEMHLDTTSIAETRLCSVEPWMLHRPKVSLAFHSDKKANISRIVFKSKFLEFKTRNLNATHIYTDGSKTKNGTAAAAVGRGRQYLCRLPSDASIFTAEARAIMLALDIVDLTTNDKFIIFSDSMSCLQAILYLNLQNPVIVEIVERCHQLSILNKNITFCWIPSHIGIPGNEKADAVAKAALNIPISTDIKISHSDLKRSINAYFQAAWQTKWSLANLNKLQSVKSTLGPTKFKGVVSRRDEVTLHRLRIGHTHLTHCCLLKRENRPICNTCQCPLTIQHILITCPTYTQIRVKHFRAKSLKELFDKFKPYRVLDFLKEIQLYDKI